jgi:pimeloyl-ACP methyl ester carboxylesterase
MLGFSVGAYDQVAKAQNVPYTFSGIVNPNITDACGLFGPVGGSLSGQLVQIIISYNAAEFIPVGNYGDQWQPNIGGAMTTSLIINGVKYGFSTGATSDDLIYSDILLARYGNDFTNTGNAIPNSGYAPNITVFVETGGKSIGLNDPAPPLVGTLVRVPIEAVTPASELCGEEVDLIVGGLNVISPFLLGKSGKGLDDLNLNTILPNLQTPDSATALAADGTSAAIVLFQVPTTAPVTFTTSIGTTLLQYDPKFLTYAPQTSGGKSLIVPSAKIITVGSALYAAALIQAPPAGVTPNYATPITITAQQQGGQVQQAYLPLVPPPVLLLHGLWGDQDSLSLYDTTLAGEAPWSVSPTLIYTSNYSGTASFTDPDSIQQVEDDFALEIQGQQTAGVVVGRTDVVAHSMGGLLVRSYSQGRKSGPCDSGNSKTAPYRGYPDRCQGQFHTIITLDTPETGSALAPFLIKNQSDTLSPNATVKEIALWRGFCGAANTTVAVCLASHQDSITGGAVESLTPNGKDLKGLASPNIPGAIWLPISATNTSGIERSSLQEFIGATNSIDRKEKLTRIIGGPNDDIVSLDSQLAGGPVNYVTFSELAHTDIFGVGAAVTNTSAVVTQAACWLNDPTSPSCNGATVRKASIDNTKEPTPTTGQVQIDQIPTTGIVGQPLILHLRARNVQAFDIEQSGEENSVRDEIDAQSAKWDGSSLEILPRRIGKTKITILTTFKDGKFEIDNGGSIDIGVDPASIASLHAVRRGHEVLMTEVNTHYQLEPEIMLQGLPQPVSVRTSASYAVTSPPEGPAVTVDSSGRITSMHSGTATIEVAYEGHRDSVTVVVQ